MEDDDDDDDLLGPKVGTKRLGTEPAREPTKEERVAALKVVIKKETPEEKEKRKRDKEAIRLSMLSEEERGKRARVEKELADSTAFLLAMDEEERRQREENTLHPDGSEKPATSKTWTASTAAKEDEANMQAADEERLDRADAALDLGAYYRERLFPVDAVVQYVTRNGRIPLRQCEFAVITQKDVFWRHRHFDKADSMRNWLAEVGPKRLEVGPWHMELSKVSMGKEPYARLPVQRYLAFDFDMCDFVPNDEKAEREGYVRKCRCRTRKNGTCSTGCWFYMKVGVQVLTYLLRNCFGAQEVLAIFSGNRGVHVMCLDEAFVELNSEQRRGVLARIKLFADPASGYYHPEHSPYIYEYIMRPAFYNHWMDGPLLIQESSTTLRMLVLCARLETAAQLPVMAVPVLVQLSSATSRDERLVAWHELCGVIGRGDGPTFERIFIHRAMFPRLDEAVTIKMDHCLKAPFVIHPSTRRCSVPIPNIDEWLPHMAPRASDLIPLPPDDRVPHWVQEKESRRCATTLAQYVQHLSAVMHRAYPPPMRDPLAPVDDQEYEYDEDAGMYDGGELL
jgi:DNA primase small subunit